MPPIKPTRYIGWTPDANPAAVTTPPRALTDMGWSPGEPMPAPYANWLFYLTDQWIQWLDQANYSTVLSTNLDSSMRLLNGGAWSYDQDTTILAWSELFNISIPGALDSANQVAAGQVNLSSGQVAYVNANVPISASGDVVSGSALIKDIDYMSGIAVGQTVRGVGIPTGATVTAISGSQVTMSAAATANAIDTPLVFQGTGALTVQTVSVDQLTPSSVTVIIARALTDRVVLGVNSGQMMLRHSERKRLLQGGFVTTHQGTAGCALPVRQPVYISSGTGDSATTSATLASGSATVTVASTASLGIGDSISGTGIPGGATILTIPSSTTFTISANATATGTQTLTVTRQQGRLYPVDASSTLGANRSNFFGFVIRAAASGAAAHVVTDGTLTGFSGLTPGKLYYVDPSTAAMVSTRTTVPGEYAIIIGLAIDSATIDINPAQSGGAGQVASASGWPNYSAINQSSLQVALAAAAAGNGGIILIVSDITLSVAITVPPRTILLGRKHAAKLILNSSASVTLADNAELRDLTLTTAQTSGAAVTAASGGNVIRSCFFQAPATGNVQLLAISGVGVRTYNSTFAGVVGKINGPTGIAYLDGNENTDDGCFFTS